MEVASPLAVVVDPRPYQREPVDVFLRRGNILLAFDTGLGKTYCAVAAAEHLIESAQVDRVLLVVPAGLKYQWAEAIARFTDLPTQTKRFKGETVTIPDSRYCMVVDGTVEKRKKQYKLAREDPRCNYMIVGYDNIDNDTRDIKRYRGEFVVLDEASAIKTLSAARTIAVKEHLSDAPWRMALTATPIDNRPDELFSIMEWVDADVLGRGDLFDKSYIERNNWGDPIGYKNLPVLVRRLGDAMYRKSVADPDVAPFMPKREILSWPVQMDVPTKDGYLSMARDLYAGLCEITATGASFNVAGHYAGHKKIDESTPVGKVMAIHMAMEMLLDHPDVLFASGLAYLSDDDGQAGSKYAADVIERGDVLDLERSPKLDTLMAKLTVLMLQPESKVIIFTRYRRMQEIIAWACQESGWDAVEYNGELSTADQQSVRARFLKNPDCRIFISTHAGERGTDLPVANWLVNVEPVWSSGQADQINGRHMRTSSEFDDIFVADMFVDGSIEERKLDQQDDKRRVSRAVVDKIMPMTGRIDLSAASLKSHVEMWLTEHDPAGIVSSVGE